MPCKVEFKVSTEPEFTSITWWAKSPEFVIDTLQRQLEAARAIWPDELKGYEIRLRSPSKSQRGHQGGEARAAALTPERRTEIASTAANVRWGTQMRASKEP